MAINTMSAIIIPLENPGEFCMTGFTVIPENTHI